MKHNRKPNLSIISEPAKFLIELSRIMEISLSITSLPLQSEWNKWILSLKQQDKESDIKINEEADIPMEHINPTYLAKEIENAITSNSVIITETGEFVSIANSIIKPRATHTFLDAGQLSAIGISAGYAIAAKLFATDAEIWIISGDGACGYSLIEFDTFVRHRIPVIAVIANDGKWGQIYKDQMKIFHSDIATTLRQQTAYHAVAEGLGAYGILVSNDAEVVDALKKAKEITKSGKPVLINFLIGGYEKR